MSEFQNRIDLQDLGQKIQQLKVEAAKALVGQDEMLTLLLTSVFAGGHVLIEGVPGIAKTLSSRLIAKMMKADFKRIQFTPDLMPSDILGTSVFNPKNTSFEYKQGPIFSNLVLIDEINRAPAKTQASLFEVMEERQVTNDGTTYSLEDLFMVLATQNPIEQEGTYRLPEAQLDRFLFKIVVTYPDTEDEVKILEMMNQKQAFQQLQFIDTVITKEEVVAIRENLMQVLTKDTLITYIADLVGKTRSHPALYLGASPRASIDLLRSSKAFAAISGRDFVTPEDIQYLFKPVVQHRISLSPEAELQGISIEEVTNQIIQQVEVPK
ncbi:MAG: MoxR family ATPase [Cyclobacteriaceae bacterium]|nr:MoxR family ATPase [Cyclobacteriaceae bacterium HetDA_MAG_MS6]